MNCVCIVSGCAGVIVGHPLDTVKVHLQTQDGRSPQYKGSMDCIRQIVRKEGLRGLYRGMSSPLAGVAGINAVIFGIYGNTQRSFADPDALTAHFLAGAAAGLFQSVLASPMELAKLKVQMSHDQLGPLDCMQKIYRTEGFRGVFRGLGITVAREVPAFGSYFLTYEYLSRTRDGAPVSTSRMLFCGGLAGVVSWTLTYPVDVLKSRLQYDPKYTGAVDCLRRSLAAEGPHFLFRGLTPALVRAFPVNAAVFTVVTWTMRLLDRDFRFDNFFVMPEAAVA
ncbi:PREDICTED: mitochondrial basic amino acids transporter [Nicrophorus vespilloides]|uniref:Mitochondrial basic amino acids transporter n=1 Tax=Nicrophorus vespilloides TaxID=110193 RepID=A0ABM1NJ60_NICVS|nr:PREDICTED: mitochondrial basic amino acids transporter [Nicrophorus vespilloides]